MDINHKKIQKAVTKIIQEYSKIHQVVEKDIINRLIYGEDYAEWFNKCAPKLSKKEEAILEQMYKLNKKVEDR